MSKYIKPEIEMVIFSKYVNTADEDIMSTSNTVMTGGDGFGDSDQGNSSLDNH